MEKEYIIPVYFQQWGTYTIKAKSLEEAIKIVFGPETHLPRQSEYVDDSMYIDYEGIDIHNMDDPEIIKELEDMNPGETKKIKEESWIVG